MKNNLNCNGCRYTVEKNRIACDCCVDRSNYSPRQRIRYGEDLDADIYTAIQKAMTNVSRYGRKGVRRIRISDASWLFSSMTISEKPWAA